eukprot:c24724_g3_i2 orf=337-648(+)
MMAERSSVYLSTFQSKKTQRGSLLQGWKYRVAQMYMVTKMQQENTSGTEGVEVLVNKPFEDDDLGEGKVPEAARKGKAIDEGKTASGALKRQQLAQKRCGSNP